MAVGKFVNKGAAGGGGTLTLTLREYTAGDTWSKPTGLVMVEVICVGGGGGGGSGGRRASGVVARGGSGGGGATIVYNQILAASLGSTETVTVGAGGTAGAAITADDTNGNSGGAGGNTSFGSHCLALGGNGAGANGTSLGPRGLTDSTTPDYAFAFAVGGEGLASQSNGNAGQNAASQDLNEGTRNFSSTIGAPAGGGVTTANNHTAGGAGNRLRDFTGNLNTAAIAGTAGGGNGNNGTANYANRMCQTPLIDANGAMAAIGSSGSGGGGNNAGTGGNGGNAGNYGQGGGGGGGARNGNNSGAGGNGSGGLCFVLEYTIT